MITFNAKRAPSIAQTLAFAIVVVEVNQLSELVWFIIPWAGTFVELFAVVFDAILISV